MHCIDLDALALSLPPFAPSPPSLPYAGGGAAAFGRHVTCWWPLLPTAALAAPASGHPGRGVTPCGLAAGSSHLRPGCGRLPLAVTPWATGPYGLAAGVNPLRAGRSRSCPWGCCHYGWPPLAGGQAAIGCPFIGGRPPLQRAWPWPYPATPCKGFLRCENTARTRRSYIPVFQIRMERVKEVKRPPL
ncbi:hypothetical protein GW17_00050982 [Ensete ventricosum]|nr:hypothetical protein GW17_00050982 [Ensete ventricosum]